MEYCFYDDIYINCEEQFVKELEEIRVLAKLMDYNVMYTHALSEVDEIIPIIVFKKKNVMHHLNIILKRDKSIETTSCHRSPSNGTTVYFDMDDKYYALRKMKELL